MSTVSPSHRIENKYDVCRSKDDMEKFIESLREHVMKVINFKKKQMKSLTKEQQKSYENGKICDISKKKVENKCLKDKRHCKFRDNSHYKGEYIEELHIV